MRGMMYYIQKKTILIISLFCFFCCNCTVFATSLDWSWNYIPQIGDELFFYGRGKSIDKELAEKRARQAARAELMEFISGWVRNWSNHTQEWHGDEDSLYNVSRIKRYDEFVADYSIRFMQYTNRVTWEFPSGGFEAISQVSLRQSQFMSILNEATLIIDNGAERYIDSIEESGQEAIRKYRQRMERLYKPTTK